VLLVEQNALAALAVSTRAYVMELDGSAARTAARDW